MDNALIALNIENDAEAVNELQSEYDGILARVDLLEKAAEKVDIRTDSDYEQIAIALKDTKATRGSLDRLSEKFTVPAHKRWKAALAFFKGPETRLEKAETAYKNHLSAYQRLQEARRLEAQRKLDEQADKERQKLAVRAEKALASGKHGKAEQLLAKAETVVAPTVSVQAPKVSGITTRKVWKFRVTNPDLIPRAYLRPNEEMIGGVVKAMKGATNIPGIEVYEDTVMGAQKS